MSAVTRRALAALLVVGVAHIAPTAAQQLTDARLEHRTASDPAAILGELGRGATWIAWTVPANADGARTCCFRRNWKGLGCRLDGRDHGFGTSSEWPKSGYSPDLVVLVEIEGGRPRSLRAVGASCPIDGAGRRVVALDGVAPASSIDLLERWARAANSDEELRDSALAAIGHHADPAAARRLERLALERGLDAELRRQALFWAGQTLGADIVAPVDRFLAAEPGDAMREHAYFVLAQAESPAAWERLRRAAGEDPSAHGRGQALFWLAQSEAPGAADWILAAIAAESDSEAREQGVFALSQLDDGVLQLVRLLRESPHADVRRQALFWLAQSDDPRAMTELEGVLDR